MKQRSVSSKGRCTPLLLYFVPGPLGLIAK